MNNKIIDFCSRYTLPPMLSKGLNNKVKNNHPILVMLIDAFTIISIIYTLYNLLVIPFF